MSYIYKWHAVTMVLQYMMFEQQWNHLIIHSSEHTPFVKQHVCNFNGKTESNWKIPN